MTKMVDLSYCGEGLLLDLFASVTRPLSSALGLDEERI